MPFEPQLIHRRTPAGAAEVYEPRLDLVQSERLVLFLIDGRVSGEGLATRLPNLGSARLAEALKRLASLGLIEVCGSRSASERPAVSAPGFAASFDEIEAGLELDPVRTLAATRASPARARPDRPRESTIVTQFAITSVNVPDALDLQEERDRAEWAEALADRRRFRLRTWAIRAGLAGGVVLLLSVGLGWWRPVPASLAPQAVSAELSRVLNRPVSVGASEWAFSPAPRLVFRDVVMAGGARAAQVSVGASWSELWRGLREGEWSWGEARISPVRLTGEEAVLLARGLLSRGDSLASRIATIQFESVEFDDTRLAPGVYEVTARRRRDDRYGRLAVRRIDSGQGRLEAAFAGATESAPLVFELEATEWRLPFGPQVVWNEARASGTVGESGVAVSHFSLAGFYGVVTGEVAAMRRTDWSIEGRAEVANLDVEALLAGRRREAGNGKPGVLQGAANAQLAVAGRGATLDSAIGASVISGSFQLRWATLNRVNLGAFAVQSAGLAGGVTRFTEFDGEVRADRYGTSFLGAGGRAGALAARGDFTVGADDDLRGLVRVELGGATVQAPITLRVRGTIAEPLFGD